MMADHLAAVYRVSLFAMIRPSALITLATFLAGARPNRPAYVCWRLWVADNGYPAVILNLRTRDSGNLRDHAAASACICWKANRTADGGKTAKVLNASTTGSQRLRPNAFAVSASYGRWPAGPVVDS